LKQKTHEAIASGIEPITISYKKINSCEYGKTFALYTEMVLNSTALGELKPEKYEVVAERTVRSEKLAIWGITYAMRAIGKLRESGIEIDFIAIRCPARAAKESFARTVERLFIKNDFSDGDNICLVFPNSILYEDSAVIKKGFDIFRRLKVKTMISDFGDEYCPVMRFANYPFDYAMVSTSPGKTIQNSSTTAVESLNLLIKNFGARTIATEPEGTAANEELTRAGFFGYLAKEPFKSLSEVIDDLKEVDENGSIEKQ